MRRGPGLVGMAARTAVVAGTATAVSGRVARRQANKYADQDAQGAQQAPAEAAAPAEDDIATQLQKLAGLRDQGLITPEDYEAKKKQLLGI